MPPGKSEIPPENFGIFLSRPGIPRKTEIFYRNQEKSLNFGIFLSRPGIP